VPSPRKVVVVNLRAQPVEIQHGSEVVVVPEFGHAELAQLPGAEGQLAELTRQGAVAVHAAKAPARPRPGGAKKKPPAKKTPPKKPQGGA
jgi:hypothetical protein